MPDDDAAMSLTPDEAFVRLLEINSRLGHLEPDDPNRPALEDQRDRLQLAMQDASDRARHPDSLAHELGNLERRLQAMDREQIRRAWPETVKWLNDPSAYSHRINKRLEEATSEERADIEARIARLRDLVDPPS